MDEYYMDVSTAVRNRIRGLLHERNITVNKLGTICGIPQGTLKNMMGGRNGLTVITLKKICDGLEITLVEFFDTDEFHALEQEIR